MDKSQSNDFFIFYHLIINHLNYYFMNKLIIKVLGVAALLMAVTLNLRHAENDYGLQSNGLWSEVVASSSSTGGSSSTGTSIATFNNTCLSQNCIGYTFLRNEQTCYKRPEGNWVFHHVYNPITESVEIKYDYWDPFAKVIEVCEIVPIYESWTGAKQYCATINMLTTQPCSDCNTTCKQGPNATS